MCCLVLWSWPDVENIAGGSGFVFNEDAKLLKAGVSNLNKVTSGEFSPERSDLKLVPNGQSQTTLV